MTPSAEQLFLGARLLTLSDLEALVSRLHTLAEELADAAPLVSPDRDDEPPRLEDEAGDRFPVNAKVGALTLGKDEFLLERIPLRHMGTATVRDSRDGFDSGTSANS